MKKIESFMTKTVAYMTTFVMGFLTIASFLIDAYFQTDYVEVIYYKSDSILKNVIFLFVLLLLIIYAYRKKIFEKISIKFLLFSLVIYVVIISGIWLYSTMSVPRADQAFVLECVEQIIKGNYTSFELDGYLRKYHNQIGLVFFFEVIFRILCKGIVNYEIIQVLNVFMITGIFVGMHLITKELTKNKAIIVLELVLSFGWFPLMLYSVFVYGVIPGLFFSVFGILFLLKYMRTYRSKYGMVTVLFLGIAIVVKQNFLIFAIAIVILLVVKAVTEKRKACMLFALLLIMSSFTLTDVIEIIYKERAGIEVESGMPISSWIAMGMEDGPLAAGWYNWFYTELYKDSVYNYEITNRESKEYIEKRLDEFINNPKECFSFYCEKNISQWNEATYESIWIATHKGEKAYKDPGKIIESIYEGELHWIVVEIMDLYQLLLYFGTLLCAVKFRKMKNIEDITLLLCVLGGFLFHTLWEAKSQYIFPYVTMMLPCASIGIINLVKKLICLKQI